MAVTVIKKAAKEQLKASLKEIEDSIPKRRGRFILPTELLVSNPSLAMRIFGSCIITAANQAHESIIYYANSPLFMELPDGVPSTLYHWEEDSQGTITATSENCTQVQKGML